MLVEILKIKFEFVNRKINFSFTLPRKIFYMLFISCFCFFIAALSFKDWFTKN